MAAQPRRATCFQQLQSPRPRPENPDVRGGAPRRWCWSAAQAKYSMRTPTCLKNSSMSVVKVWVRTRSASVAPDGRERRLQVLADLADLGAHVSLADDLAGLVAGEQAKVIDRALDFLREAESRQFELSDAERKTLNTDILRARAGCEGWTTRMPSPRTGKPWAPEHGRLIGVGPPRRDRAVRAPSQRIKARRSADDSAHVGHREEPAESARRPATSGPGPESLPPLPPMDSVAPAQSPEPLSVPAELAEPRSLSESPEPAILPPRPGAIADEPPALAPLSPPADVAPPAETPLSDPLPNTATVELSQPPEAPLSEPPPEIVPVELPQNAALASPQPAATELPSPILLEEVEDAPVPVPVSTPKPTAAQPVDQDPTALPPLVLDETPATDPVPVVESPVDDLKIPETTTTEPPIATEPVEAPLPEPVVRTAQSEPIADDQPQAAPAPVADEPPAPEASEVALPPLPEAITAAPAAAQPAARADSLAVPSLADRATSALSEHKRPVLSDASKRRIEQIARRQQEDSARNPVPPIDEPLDNPLMGIDELASNRLELPRAPEPDGNPADPGDPDPRELRPPGPSSVDSQPQGLDRRRNVPRTPVLSGCRPRTLRPERRACHGHKGPVLVLSARRPSRVERPEPDLQPFYSIGLFASQVGRSCLTT